MEVKTLTCLKMGKFLNLKNKKKFNEKSQQIVTLCFSFQLNQVPGKLVFIITKL